MTRPRTLRERIQQPTSLGDGISAYAEAFAHPERVDRCMAAKFLRNVGDRPGNRHAIYAHCDRVVHEDENAHHFVDPYGRTV